MVRYSFQWCVFVCYYGKQLQQHHETFAIDKDRYRDRAVEFCATFVQNPDHNEPWNYLIEQLRAIVLPSSE